MNVSHLLDRLVHTAARGSPARRHQHAVSGVKADQNLPHFYRNEPLTTSRHTAPYNFKLKTETLSQLLVNAAKSSDAERLVFSETNRRISVAESLEEVDRIAVGLIELGLKPGDRVAVYGVSTYEWWVSAYAATRAGLVVVCMNAAFSPLELVSTLNKVGAKAIIASPGVRHILYYQVLCMVAPELPGSEFGRLESKSLPFLKHVIFMDDEQRAGTATFGDIAALGDSLSSARRSELIQASQRSVTSDSPALIQFTSGTTGVPKGAYISHESLINTAYSIIDRIVISKDSVVSCQPVQMFHAYGFIPGIVLPCCYTGSSKVVVPSSVFSPTATLKAIEAERGNCVIGTPTMYIDMLTLHRSFDLSSLLTCIVGGAPVPETLMRSIGDEFQVEYALRGFGMTETNASGILNYWNDIPAMRFGTDGYPLGGTEVKISDSKGGSAAIGDIGELCIKGLIVADGYWEEQENTKNSFDHEGFFKTGDLARMDGNGYITLTGRLKELIIRGGLNIHAVDVEDQLLKFNKRLGNGIVFNSTLDRGKRFFRMNRYLSSLVGIQFNEVKEVAVFGIPDSRLGERVAMAIVLKSDVSCTSLEVTKFLQDKLASYKIPEMIEFLQEFPMTATGKVKKMDLQKMFAKINNERLVTAQ